MLTQDATQYTHACYYLLNIKNKYATSLQLSLLVSCPQMLAYGENAVNYSAHSQYSCMINNYTTYYSFATAFLAWSFHLLTCIDVVFKLATHNEPITLQLNLQNDLL